MCEKPLVDYMAAFSGLMMSETKESSSLLEKKVKMVPVVPAREFLAVKP
jgi:hypothetical protein